MASTPASASRDFSVTLQSTYTVTSTGNSFVEQKFQLTNNSPTLYAKDYAVEYDSSKLSNIRVTTGQNPLPAEIVSTGSKTSIDIHFPDNLVGEGKSRTFFITYENPEIAQVSGNILEVNIPKLSKSSDYSQYQVIMKTPLQFGNPVRVTPSSYQLSQDSTNVVIQLSQLGTQGIAAVFGAKQVFDFTLVNNVSNPTNDLGIVQIALPPDTNRQKVAYESLNPAPKDIVQDADGNWIATYEIAAEKELAVTLTGKAILTLDNSQKLNLPPPDQRWWQPQTYWETTDQQLQKLAANYQNPKAIYDFVVSHLTYNYQREQTPNGKRLGAAGILADPTNAVCQEFTDLFVALARANHIPARRAVGYAYTANSHLRPLGFVQDTLHTWPEYFDQTQQIWIPVDPTWENTTGGVNYFDQFDFNHFVFSYNGLSSTLPYASGSYQSDRQLSHNIEVKFGTDSSLPAPHFRTEVTRNSFWSSPLHPQYRLKITNQTGIAWYNLPIKLQSDQSNVTVTGQTNLDYLLPFQSREITITADPSQKFQAVPFRLTVGVDSLSSTYELNTGINIQGSLNPNFVAVGLVGSMVIITALAWGLLVSRRPRHRAVRR